jgi:glutaryl-CoA dehydrogenase
MENYKSADFFELDSLLTAEQKLIRNTVRQFVNESVLLHIREWFSEGQLPLTLAQQMGKLGLFGANLKEYGAGVDAIAYGLIMQELERGDSGLRSFASVQSGLVMYPIYAFGSPQQKEKWLPKLASGEAIGCFGLTEPGHGSDPGGMETKAIKEGNTFVLTGNKTWITNGSHAHVAVVWAKLDGVVRGFLVEKGTPGFKAAKIEHKLSMRASDTSELYFDKCKIPQENLLPGVEGLKGPLMCLNQARYGIAWGAIGAAMACYDEALHYSLERVQFGKPLGSFQLVQRKLVEMVSEITKAQLLCYRLGQLKDEDRIKHYHISMAKRNNVAMALHAARMARDILGANGITLDYQAIRHMVNLETVYTYEGTHDIHTLIIGNEITGLEAFR